MAYLTTLTQKWQMTLPKAVREQLGIDTPGRVTVRVMDKKKNLVTIEKTPDILDLAESLPAINSRGEKIDVANIRDYLEENYQRE